MLNQNIKKECFKGSDFQKRLIDISSPKVGTFYRAFISHFRLFKLLYIVTRRNFLQRLLNYCIYLLEKKRVARLHYLPPMISIDPNTTCLLRCKGCPTGIKHPECRNKGGASFEMMKLYIDQAYKKSLQLKLYNWGEPLLGKDFFKACSYAAEKGLWTMVHSCLSIKMDDLAQRIIEAKLCNLTVACDGATQEIYEMYRVNGNVDLVFENIKKISQEKKKRKSKLPWITAKFLIFEHNWHEIKLFKERAEESGADDIIFMPGGTLDEGLPGTGKFFNLKELEWKNNILLPFQPCRHLWEVITIDHDGAVFPCCMGFREQDLIIDQRNQPFRDLSDLWNSEAYVSLRKYYIGKGDKSMLKGLCVTCKSTW